MNLNNGVLSKIFVLACLIFHLNSQAACCSLQTGLVTSIGTLPNGIFFFKINGAIDNKGTCNTSIRYTLNINQANQKSMMALVIGAYFSEKNIQVTGLTTCNNWSDSEDAGYISSQ